MIREQRLKKEQDKKRKKKVKKKNTQIMAVTCFFVLLFLGMSGYITHYSLTHKQELIDNSYNKRQEILLTQNRRGNIYSADGQILAESVENENGKEIRNYPFGTLFSHAVGYSTYGKLGVEAQANYYLINSNAPLADKAALDEQGQKYPGDDVYTTLDVELQQVASTALGVYQGAVIVTEPSTGKILAMVSKPDFDPNRIGEMWEELVADTESSVLLNRATQGLYPPGSTFKIITSLEYIRENPETYQDYHYNCTGSLTRGDERIQCYHGSVHNSIGFSRSFAKSCNSSYANIGLSLDRAAFSDTLDQLLFGKELPVKFPYSISRADVSAQTSDAEMMQVSIGQGTVTLTPLHLNMITGAIANQGMLMKPYVVDCVKNHAGNTVKSFSPSAYGSLMSEQEAAILGELMTDVVEEGTASRLKGLSYTAAGKTGSAEYGTVKGDSHAWFTGYAPAENPEICVTIIIEGAGVGGDYAVPIAKRLFDAYFGV